MIAKSINSKLPGLLLGGLYLLNYLSNGYMTYEFHFAVVNMPPSAVRQRASYLSILYLLSSPTNKGKGLCHLHKIVGRMK